MPLITESVVRPADQMSDGHIEDIYNATREAVYASHVRSMGTDGNYLIRATVPADLGEATTGPSSTTNVWAETVTASGTAGFQDSKIASQNVPDNTSVALYGFVDSSDGGQHVSQIRITTGQGVRAIWDLFPIIGSDPSVSGSVRCRTMYAMTPISISNEHATEGTIVSLYDSNEATAAADDLTERGASIQIGPNSTTHIDYEDGTMPFVTNCTAGLAVDVGTIAIGGIHAAGYLA
jgi:hypothetical protein